MGLLKDLQTTLEERFQTDTSINASDLGGDAEIFFKEIFPDQKLEFTDPTLDSSDENKLIIGGKLSIFGLNNIDFKMVIQASEDDTSLSFYIIPKSSLPEGWEFSTSFNNLKESVFDNLKFSESYLIISSIDKQISTPNFYAKKGINFYGKALVDKAIKSLASLNDQIDEITLVGIIENKDDNYNVSLKAQLDDFNINLTSPQFYLKHDSSKEDEKDNAKIKGTITNNDFNFPYDFDVPIKMDPLDELESLLKSRLSEGNITFKDVDLGEEKAPEFFNEIWQNEIELTNATINREDDELILSGDGVIFNNPNSSSISIRIICQDDNFEFTVINQPRDDWKLSQSFLQVENSLLDELKLSNNYLIATSYEHSFNELSINLKVGLNFYTKPSLIGPLDCLSLLGDMFDNIVLNGSIEKIPSRREDSYDIKISSLTFEDISIDSPRFSTINLKSPQLKINSVADGKTNEITNQIFIDSIVNTGTLLDFSGSLFLPNYDEPFWMLSMKEDSLDLPSMNQLLNFSGVSSLSIFPDNLTALDKLQISDIKMLLKISDDKIGSLDLEVSLKPNQDGSLREFTFLQSPKLAFGNLKFGLGLTYYSYDVDKSSMTFRCVFSGVINIGETSSITANLTVVPDGDWKLALLGENEKIPTLDDLAKIIWPDNSKDKDGILSILPSGLINGPDMNISEVELNFNPLTPSFSSASFLLSQESDWQVTPFLAFNSWEIFMKADVRDNVKITGFLDGDLKIGDVNNPIGTFNANLPIPASNDGWTIKLKEGTTFDVSKLGDILGLIGGKDFASNLPLNISDLGGLTIETFEVNFVPDPAKLNYFNFGMFARDEWSLIENVLSFKNIIAELNLRLNQENKYDLTGIFSCIVSVATKPLRVEAAKKDVNDNWKFYFSVQEPIHIFGLEEIAQWMLPESMVSFIPESFMPFGKGFDLTDLNIDLDLNGSKVNMINFQIINSDKWQMIPNISLDKINISAKIENNDDNLVLSNCNIEGQLNLCDVFLNLKSSKSSVDALWSFDLDLNEPVTLDFDKMLSELSSFSLPSIMPQQITVDDFSLNIVPSTQYYLFSGSGSVKWEIDFALSSFSVEKLGGKLEIKEKEITKELLKEKIENLSDDDAQTILDSLTENKYIDSETKCPLVIDDSEELNIPSHKSEVKDILSEIRNNRNYSANIFGDFNFASIDAQVKLELGSEEDTILTAELSGEKASSISLSNLSDSLTIEENDESDDKWEDLMPSDLITPSYDSVKMHLNLSKDTFILFGNSSDIGSLAFITKKVEVPAPNPDPEELDNDSNQDSGNDENSSEDDDKKETKWGYFLSAALTPEFKFESIAQPLSVIDGILKIKNAGFAISSFYVDSLKELTSPIPEFSSCVPQISDDEKIEVHPGAIFYGQLDFSSSLFGNIIKAADDLDSDISISLYGLIANDDSTNTLFSASVPGFTILDIVTFENINLKYLPNKNNEFNLSGNMKITIDDSDYNFEGDLLITKQTGHFEVGTADEIENPLGMPEVTLKEIKLTVNYNFSQEENNVNNENNDESDSEDTSSTSKEIKLTGKVGFGSKDADGKYPINLEGNILFDPSPVVTEIALSSPLSVDDFFTTVLPGNIWPEGFLDITFNTGRIYYAEKNCKLLGYDYKKDFHIDTQIDIYGFVFNVKADVFDNGIKISGNNSSEIDFSFVQFTDKNFSGSGPAVYIHTTPDDTKFGLTSGIKLFQENIMSTDLSFNTTKQKFEGEVAYEGDIDLFKGDKVGFSWNDEEGFRITSWPMSWITDALKYVDLIKKASEMVHSPCGEIVDWVFDEIITTKFNITPEFLSLTEDGKLPIKLKIGYEIDIAGNKIIESFLPDIQIDIDLPKELSLSKFAEKIITTITNNAFKIGEQILSDNEKLTEFIAAVGLTNIAEQTASSLICMGEENISNPPSDPGGSPPKSGDELLKEAKDAASAASEATLEEALSLAAEASVAAVAAVGIFVSAIDFFKSLLNKFLSIFGIETKEAREAREKKEEAERKKAEAEQAKQDAIHAIEEKIKVQNLSVDFDENNKELVVSWDRVGCSEGSINYAVTVYKNNNPLSIVSQQTITNNNLKVSCANQYGTNNFTILVTTKLDYSKDGEDYSYSGTAPTINKEVTILTPPKNLSLEQVNGNLKATWEKGDDITTSYNLNLIDKSGYIILSKENIASCELDINHKFTDNSGSEKELVSGESYNVTVQGVKDNFHSDRVESNVVDYSVTKLEIPTEVNLAYDEENNQFTVTWKEVDLCENYEVVISDVNDEEKEPITGSTSEKSLVITFGSEDQIEGNYQAKVIAQALEGKYVESDPGISNTIFRLPVPSNIVQTFDKEKNSVTVEWDNLSSEKITNYNLYLFDLSSNAENDNSLDPLQTISVPVPQDPTPKISKEIDLNQFVTDLGAEFKIKIKSIGTDEDVVNSTFGETNTSIICLAKPINVTEIFYNQNPTLTVEWDKVINSLQYKIEVVEIDTGDLIANKTIDSNSDESSEDNKDRVNCIFVKEDFNKIPNGFYHTKIQAIGDENTIDSKISLSNYLPIPSIILPELNLSFDKNSNKIIANWQISDKRDYLTYDLQLFDSSGSQIGETITGAYVNAEFIIENYKKDIYTVKIRASYQDYQTSWSSGKNISTYVPEKPKNVNLVYNGKEKQIGVTWDDVKNATSFDVKVFSESTPNYSDEVIISESKLFGDTGTSMGNTKELKQIFTSTINGTLTEIMFDRGYRPEVGTSSSGKIYFYKGQDDKKELITTVNFPAGNNQCVVPISAEIENGQIYTFKIVYDDKGTFHYRVDWDQGGRNYLAYHVKGKANCNFGKEILLDPQPQMISHWPTSKVIISTNSLEINKNYNVKIKSLNGYLESEETVVSFSIKESNILKLNGDSVTHSYVKCGNKSDLHFKDNKPYTMVAWVKYNDLSLGTLMGRLVSSSWSGGPTIGGYCFFPSFSGLRAYRYADPYFCDTNKNILRNGKKYCLVNTYNENTLKLYVDGNQVALVRNFKPMINPPDNAEFLIGSCYRGDIRTIGQGSKCVISCAAVFNRELNPDEIKNLLNQKLVGTEDGLLALWDFTSGSAKDLTNNGHDGTLMGTAKFVLKREFEYKEQ